jgi:glycosyltransferase involved in cell wall biosynthesis
MKPVLFVTGHVPPDRAGAFRALHEQAGIELALFGGRSKHATAGLDDPGVPHAHVSQRQVARLAASGRYRAVVCGTGGRVALPAAYAGARSSRAPFVLWASLWAHPRTAAHALSYLPLRRVYAGADAVVTYGPHVSSYVAARGARNVHVAPQSVDNDYWSATAPDPVRPAPFTCLFVGRDSREKGLWVLREAWSTSGLESTLAALVLVGVGPGPPRARAGGAVIEAGAQPPGQVRNFYAGASVLVMPSLHTRTFREPWGLVANEAMNQQLPVIASDEVGAVAGGLVVHERNGLVFPAGDHEALAGAIRRLHDDLDLRARLGVRAVRDVASYTHEAWASGFASALRSVGAW